MDVYKVGVSLILNNGVSSGLNTVIRQLGQANSAVVLLNNNLGRLKLAAAGAAGVLAGEGMLKGMVKLVDHGNELIKIQRNMAQAGVKQVEIQEAYNKAWEMTRKHTNISATEVMKMINDARMTFGSQHDATHHIEDFVQMASFLKAYQGGKHANKGAELLAEVNAAMKSGEIAGKITPAEMAEHVKQLTAMKVAYGEQLKIGQYLTAQRAAGVALRNTSDDFRYGMFPALVQENGPNAGTMLMTAFNKVVAGTGNRTKSLERMAEIGLLNKDQLEYTSSGHIKGLKNADAIKGSHEAAMNFGNWVMKTLKPMLDKKTGGDPIKEAQFISSMFPDRNAAKAITEIIQQFRKLEKDAEQMRAARQAMDMGKYVGQDYDAQRQAFHTQLDNLMKTLGGPLVGPATEMLKKINEALSGLAQWANANPAAVKIAMEVLAALGASLFVASLVALGAAIAPLIGVGAILTGLAAGLAALAAMNWESIKATFEKIGPTIIDALKAAAAFAIGGIPGVFVGIGAAIISALKNAVGNAIGGALGNKGQGGVGNPMGDFGGGAGPMNYRAAPPVRSGGGGMREANVIMDGQKVGKIVTKHIARNGSGPLEGTVYPDATRLALRNDTSYVV